MGYCKVQSKHINSSSKTCKSQDNSRVAEPRRGGLPFNNCEGYYSDFT